MAILNSSGIKPVDKDKLNRKVSGFMIIGRIVLRSFVETKSAPQLVLGFRVPQIFSINVAETFLNEKGSKIGFPRYSLKCFCAWGMAFASSGPIFEKKSLNLDII